MGSKAFGVKAGGIESGDPFSRRFNDFPPSATALDDFHQQVLVLRCAVAQHLRTAVQWSVTDHPQHRSQVVIRALVARHGAPQPAQGGVPVFTVTAESSPPPASRVAQVAESVSRNLVRVSNQHLHGSNSLATPSPPTDGIRSNGHFDYRDLRRPAAVSAGRAVQRSERWRRRPHATVGGGALPGLSQCRASTKRFTLDDGDCGRLYPAGFVVQQPGGAANVPGEGLARRPHLLAVVYVLAGGRLDRSGAWHTFVP